jgi:hypothetical protein
MKHIIEKLITKSAREEALEIINNSTKEERIEFLQYYYDNKENICCLVLDKIKDRLVEEKKMKKGGRFGDWFGDLKI